MGKLNQVIAVVAGKKANATKVITETYHTVQKNTLFEGISRTYQPKDEDGDKLPKEEKFIQKKAGELITDVKAAMIEMFDVVATQDAANCVAKADVKVGAAVVLKQVPVTHLLFLEKQLNDITTFIGKLPTLDPSETWVYNEAADHYATVPSETTRTKKVPKAFVKYAATKEHPAQVETFQEDVLAGYWKTIKFSGAIPAQERNQMLEKVRQLHEAVVNAREEANGIEVQPVHVGKALFDYILGS
jgi:hypothetical protein